MMVNVHKPIKLFHTISSYEEVILSVEIIDDIIGMLDFMKEQQNGKIQKIQKRL